MAEVVVTGQRTIPKRLMDAGYRFKYSKCDQALEAIFG